MSRDPLALDVETMRRMGYAVVDLLVDRVARLRDEPVIRTATRAEMGARIAEPPPEGPGNFEALLARLDRDVLPFVGHFDHPSFFGYIPGAGTWPGALGDLIGAAMNVDAGAWHEGGRSQSARADGRRLVPRLDRLPHRGRGDPRLRRLRRQPYGHRLCP
jgi:hypothetical protein